MGSRLRPDATCFRGHTRRHLLSTHPKGIEIQAYCAIMACLLISLWTGRKPTLRTYEMICLYFAGWASLEELLEHINKLKDATV